MKSISINNLTPKLSKIVQQLLFDHGYPWASTGAMLSHISDNGLHISHCNINERLVIWRWSDKSSDIQIDASTEFGKLIELLEKKTETVIRNVTDQGDNGTIAEDKQSVKVGCRTVARDKVKEIWKAMQ